MQYSTRTAGKITRIITDFSCQQKYSVSFVSCGSGVNIFPL